MFTTSITPRFSDTDALGHINNTLLPIWFERARVPIFRFFTPDLDTAKWNLVLARIEIDFLQELFHGTEVEIKSYITHIGNSSFIVGQEAWQNDTLCCRGASTMVRYAFTKNKSQPLSPEIRDKLAEHMQTAQKE